MPLVLTPVSFFFNCFFNTFIFIPYSLGHRYIKIYHLNCTFFSRLALFLDRSSINISRKKVTKKKKNSIGPSVFPISVRLFVCQCVCVLSTGLIFLVENGFWYQGSLLQLILMFFLFFKMIRFYLLIVILSFFFGYFCNKSLVNFQRVCRSN